MSCSSAVSVYGALTGAGHRVIPVGIDRQGDWFLADTAYRPFRADGRPVSFSVPAGVLEVSGQQVEFDVVFPVLHGPMGEDGTVQGLFDTSGVPYVGCGVRASALTMDKDFTKRIVRAAGIDTSPWLAVRKVRWDTEAPRVLDEVTRQLRYPLFVKPSAQGSSVGISKVTDVGALEVAMNEALRYDTKVVVEEAIDGREIEVAVLGNTDLRVSVPGEIRPGAEFYDYDDKYLDGSADLIIPADLPAAVLAELEDLARKSFRALRVEGMGRVDFLYEEGGR